MTGGVPCGPRVVEHLSGCEQCRELFGNRAQLGRGLARVAPCRRDRISEQLLATEALIAGERGVRAFLRSRSTRLRLGSSLSLPALLLLRELAGKPIALHEFNSLRILAGVLLLGLLGIVVHSALRPLPGQPRAARLCTVLALTAWCLPCALLLLPQAPSSPDALSRSDFALRSLTCFGYGSALAAPSFALLWAFERGERLPRYVWALGTGLVAVLSSLILLLHCPSTQRVHLIAGHFSIGPACFLLVAIVSRWASAVRSR
jgi:hypothetical protein